MKFIVTVSFFTAVLFFYLYLSLSKHFAFESFAFDLGIYSQASWLISHFKIPFSTILGVNKFGDHFSPIYIFLSLGYRLFNSPVYLLTLQALSVVLSGIPIYLVAKERLRRNLETYLVTTAYFLQIGLVYAINFDFHVATLSVVLISWTLYFWYKNQTVFYLIFLILSLTAKEDIPVLFIFFSLYLFLNRQRKLGLITLLFSFFWYLAVTKIITPYFSGQPYAVNKIMVNLSDWREKTETLKRTFGQNLGFSLFSALGWFFAIPNLLSRFLSGAPGRSEWFWHYGANLAAPLFFSTIFSLDKLRPSGRRFLISLMILLATLYFGQPLRLIENRREGQPTETLNQAVRFIPETASVSAQDILVPHLAQREKIFLYPAKWDEADYVVLALGRASFPISQERLLNDVLRLKQTKGYAVWERDGVYVFKKVGP